MDSGSTGCCAYVPMQRMQLLETRSKVRLDALTKVKGSQDLSLTIERALSTNLL